MKFTGITILSVLILGVRFAPAQAVDLPSVDSFSTDFISVATEESYTSTIALYGTNLDYLLFNPTTIQFGAITGTVVSGNDTGLNVSFTIDSSLISEREMVEPLTITLADASVIESTSTVTVFNPFVGEYVKQQSKQLTEQIQHPHQRTKETIGLNVHWTLGGEAELDDLYAQRLDGSHTSWVREHISYEEVMGDDSAAWLKRYDQTMLNYRDRDLHVVAMLAYGDGSDPYRQPDHWKQFVRMMAKRYGNYVDAWEIWNEPDSSTYLSPHSNWKTYRPILKTGSAMIREYDPDAVVLTGAVSELTDLEFTKKLYQKGKRYFDDFNMHPYYCDEYVADGSSLQQMTEAVEQIIKVVNRYRPADQIWITEFGCSTGTAGVTNKIAKHYIKQGTKALLSYDQVGPILLYTFRDRTYLTDDPYEAYFGLMDENLEPKPIWSWYRQLKRD